MARSALLLLGVLLPTCSARKVPAPLPGVSPLPVEPEQARYASRAPGHRLLAVPAPAPAPAPIGISAATMTPTRVPDNPAALSNVALPTGKMTPGRMATKGSRAHHALHPAAIAAIVIGAVVLITPLGAIQIVVSATGPADLPAAPSTSSSSGWRVVQKPRPYSYIPGRAVEWGDRPPVVSGSGLPLVTPSVEKLTAKGHKRRAEIPLQPGTMPAVADGWTDEKVEI